APNGPSPLGSRVNQPQVSTTRKHDHRATDAHRSIAPPSRRQGAGCRPPAEGSVVMRRRDHLRGPRAATVFGNALPPKTRGQPAAVSGAAGSGAGRAGTCSWPAETPPWAGREMSPAVTSTLRFWLLRATRNTVPRKGLRRRGRPGTTVGNDRLGRSPRLRASLMRPQRTGPPAADDCSTWAVLTAAGLPKRGISVQVIYTAPRHASGAGGAPGSGTSRSRSVSSRRCQGLNPI